MRDVVKQLILSLQEKYQAIIEGEKPFLEKLELIVFDKTEIARQYNEEFIQRVVSNDPEIQQFINSMWEGKVNQMMIDFFEEGKRQGYVTPELSQETILLYTEYRDIPSGHNGSPRSVCGTGAQREVDSGIVVCLPLWSNGEKRQELRISKDARKELTWPQMRFLLRN